MLFTWEEFKKAFTDQIYPHFFCDTKRKEFMSLAQGDIIVVENEKRFTKLSKFVVAFVIDEIDKCKQFEEGLWTENRAPITTTMN